MDGARQLLGEHGIDGALAGDSALAGERGGVDLDAEMGLAFGPRPGMAGVAVGIVVNGEAAWLKGRGELGVDALGDGHGAWSLRQGWSAVGSLSRPPIA